MDLEKVERNLTHFSNYVVERMESEIDNLEVKSARRKLDKAMKEKLNI